MQSFDADLLVASSGNFGGCAFADAHKLQKAEVQVPGFTPPLVRHVNTGLSADPVHMWDINAHVKL